MATKQGKCGWCGKDPALGLAKIGDVFYCHEGRDPTCYMEASWYEAGFPTKTPPVKLKPPF